MPSITFKNANELRARRPGISNRVLKVPEIWFIVTFISMLGKSCISNRVLKDLLPGAREGPSVAAWHL